MKENTSNPKPVKKYIFIALIVLFALIFIFCAVQIIAYFVDSSENKQLAGQLQNMHTTGPSTPSTVTQPTTEPTGPTAGTEPEPTVPPILEELEQIYQLNEHVVGWVSIEGTNVDYPVLQTPDTAEWRNYYLYRDFYGEDSKHGSIYAREACDIFAPSDNVTIYGHNMNDRTMFGDLWQYGSYNFYQEHKYIQFDTLYERHTYEIFAVFRESVNQSDSFDYHLFDDAEIREEYEAFVRTCLDKSLYTTGLVPEYGDKLLTLSTCDFHVTNGRLVLVAVRIS